ncbi:MAG: HAD family hydrolase [Acidimicrobiales bacterium]
MPLRAVTFDFWNTLIRADDGGVSDRRLAAWLGLLAGEGFDLERDVVGGAMHHAGRRFNASWRANRMYQADDAVTDMLVHLGVEPSAELRAGLVSSITDPDPAHDPQPATNVGAALDALRQAGVRIGIICDVGLAPSATLRRYLDRHGLLGHFDHWSFSDEVGCFKPDPAIFAHARAGLGDPPPDAMAHVGDLRRTDVAGAQAAGWFAVRYTGVADDLGSTEDGSDTVEADAVVADHAELAAALGVA